MIEGIDVYLSYGSVKSAWITLYILSIIWGALYVLKPLLGDRTDVPSDVDTTDDNKKSSSGGILSRIGRAYMVVRNNSLMLLVSLTFNTFGTASTKVMGIISWIYFVITVIYALAILFMEHRIIKTIFNLIAFVLVLIMSSLALKNGW